LRESITGKAPVTLSHILTKIAKIVLVKRVGKMRRDSLEKLCISSTTQRHFQKCNCTIFIDIFASLCICPFPVIPYTVKMGLNGSTRNGKISFYFTCPLSVSDVDIG